jgi:hypothetical protein
VKTSKAAPAEAPPPHGLRVSEVQELWYALQRLSWLSLALVPAHGEGSGAAVARALAEVGSALRATKVHCFDAEGSDSESVVRCIVDIRAFTRREEPVLVPVDPPTVNPTSISVVRSVDAALLVIEPGRSDLGSARKTLELLGPDRVVGSVLLPRR